MSSQASPRLPSHRRDCPKIEARTRRATTSLPHSTRWLPTRIKHLFDLAGHFILFNTLTIRAALLAIFCSSHHLFDELLDMDLSHVTTAASLMLTITWACVAVSDSGVWLNPRFRAVLPSLAVLSELFDAATLSFAPGLLDLIGNADPPSLDWFLSLPSDIPANSWGVYVLVLHRNGKSPRIYIGSGTAFSNGIRGRVGEHLRGKNSPKYLKKALRNGWIITKVAVLAHCAIPNAALVPRIRTAIIALEAAFSCLFWSMLSRSTDYAFGHICP